MKSTSSLPQVRSPRFAGLSRRPSRLGAPPIALLALAIALSLSSLAMAGPADGEARRGTRLYESGDYKGAAEAFEKALELSKQRGEPPPALPYNLGTVYSRLGEIDKAIEYLKDAAANAGDDSSPEVREHAWYNLGVSQAQAAGMNGKANARSAQVSTGMHEPQGAQARLQMLKNSLNSFRQSLVIDPGDDQARQNFALTYRQVKELEKQIQKQQSGQGQQNNQPQNNNQQKDGQQQQNGQQQQSGQEQQSGQQQQQGNSGQTQNPRSSPSSEQRDSESGQQNRQQDQSGSDQQQSASHPETATPTPTPPPHHPEAHANGQNTENANKEQPAGVSPTPSPTPNSASSASGQKDQQSGQARQKSGLESAPTPTPTPASQPASASAKKTGPEPPKGPGSSQASSGASAGGAEGHEPLTPEQMDALRVLNSLEQDSPDEFKRLFRFHGGGKRKLEKDW